MDRVKHRQNTFMKLRDLYSTLVQKSFTDMLSLRQYKVAIEECFLIILYCDFYYSNIFLLFLLGHYNN